MDSPRDSEARSPLVSMSSTGSTPLSSAQSTPAQPPAAPVLQTSAAADSPFRSEEATPTGSPKPGPASGGAAIVTPSSSGDAFDPSRLPGILGEKIAEDIYDAEAWQTLLSDVLNEGEVAKVREVFEQFLKVFPTSSRHWIQYAEFELKHHHFTEVEKLFQRCLRSVLSVELWKFYLNYIRRINTGPDAKAIITQAYEFVLQHVGLDRDSGPIWSDYLFFLKSGQAQNTWEEQQKMDAMRRVFQRAVCIPLNNIENIWRDYDSFENGLNKLTAKKFLQERSAGYMTARMMWRELKKLTDGLAKNALPRPVKWTERELHQLEQWKRYIHWEKTNPLNFEDPTVLSARVAWTYKQALLSMRFYPEIWFDAATYFQEVGRGDEATALLKNACEIMPTSFLLHFAYAEMEESRKNLKESRGAYEALVKNLTEKIDDMNKRVTEEVRAAMAALQAEQQLLDGGGPASAGSNKKVRDIEEVDGEMRERERDELKKRTKELQQYEKLARKEVEELIKGAGLAWIMFMQYVRRTEGTSQWRHVFGRARKSNACPFQVYIAAALLEYHCTKDKTIAGKVFELGYKSFSDESAYVEQYLEFLIQLDDDSNARALFERALISMSPEKARPLWEKFSEYENKYGDLTAILKVEKRRREVYPKEAVLDRFAARYGYDDLRVIEELDMGASIRKNLHLPAFGDFASEFPPPPEVDLDNAALPGRRPLMEPVNPDLYPRPEFGMWHAVRVTPDMIRKSVHPPRISTARPGDMDTVPHHHGEDVEMRGPPPPPMPPKAPVPPMMPNAPGPPQPPMAHHPQQHQQQQHQQQQQGGSHGSPLIQQQQTPVPSGPPTVPGWTAGPHGLIPDAVAFFLSNLPPAASFNGPVLGASEILELIRGAVIPVGQTLVVPPPVPVLPSGPVPSLNGVPHSGAGGGGGGFRDHRDPRDMRDSRGPPPMPPSGSLNRDRDGRDMRDSRDRDRDRDVRGGSDRDRDRGGYKPRGGGLAGGGGGGRGGLKRKGRDHEDEGMGGGGGPGAGRGGGEFRGGPMPGINRPPEYDVFRFRQQRKANME